MGLRSANWWLQNQHGDVKQSLGKTVNNIVITTYMPSGYLNYQREPSTLYMELQLAGPDLAFS